MSRGEWKLPVKRKEIGRRKILSIIGIALGVLLVTVLIVNFGLGLGGGEDEGLSPTSEKYGFETSTQGWQYQTWSDSQAITSVAQYTGDAKYGSASLQCTVNLIGGHDNNSKGEAWVDLQLTPPGGVTAPVDLSNATVSVWVHLPAEATGDPSKPNGIQLFVKDENWNNRYSSWKNIGTQIPTNVWHQIKVNTATEYWAWPLPGDNENIPCDLTQVRALGVKIGAGGGSTENFSGSIWIDSFGW